MGTSLKPTRSNLNLFQHDKSPIRQSYNGVEELVTCRGQTPLSIFRMIRNTIFQAMFQNVVFLEEFIIGAKGY